LAVEAVQSQLRRDKGPHLTFWNRPVRKKQIVPGLLHDPRAARQRPGTMLDDPQ
jgi:hypothetical protein